MQNPIIVAELKRIADEHGGILKPRSVVDAARDESSPLHSQFQWDDDKAADAYRLWQARQLISVVVAYEKIGNGESVEVRVFTSLTTDRERDDGGYRVTTSVMSDEQLRRQMLADARADMVRFREKYRTLSELADVFKAIDESVREREVAKAS